MNRGEIWGSTVVGSVKIGGGCKSESKGFVCDFSTAEIPLPFGTDTQK